MSREEQMRRFWSRFSLRELSPFLVAVFFTFVASGFLRDLQELGLFTPAYLAFTAVATGVMAVGYAVAMARNPRRWLPVVLAVQLGIEYAGRHWLGTTLAPAPWAEQADRLRWDATASILTLFVGYLGFVGFIARQGVRHLRVDTDGPACQIHETLVPRVEERGAGLEALGGSFPAHEIGGDLVDAVWSGPRLTCFVVDVSGHGVPAATLMAALKSAARMRLLGPASCGELLTDLNRVLFAIKRPNIFATAACLSIDPRGASYGLAGHLPILHWRRATRDVVRLGERRPWGSSRPSDSRRGVSSSTAVTSWPSSATGSPRSRIDGTPSSACPGSSECWRPTRKSPCRAASTGS
jgi:hypothetical protein